MKQGHGKLAQYLGPGETFNLHSRSEIRNLGGFPPCLVTVAMISKIFTIEIKIRHQRSKTFETRSCILKTHILSILSYPMISQWLD